MVEETVNYRESNNIKRNDFMQLLIQIKNKVKLDEENENIEQIGHGTLENKSSEDGMYAQWDVVRVLEYKFSFPYHVT
jgi:cytochrome P450 family 6